MRRSTPLISATLLSAALAAPDIFVAYPPDGYKVAYDHVLFEGSVPAGASFNIDGRAIDTGPDGLFIEWLPLKPGLNTLQLETSLNGQTVTRAYQVTSNPPVPLPETPTVITAGSVTPGANRIWYDLSALSLPERTVTVSFQGSPGGQASFKIGDRGPFPMLERKAEDYPGSAAVPGGTYEGSYLLQPGETLQDAAVTVGLTGKDGQTVGAPAAGKLSVTGRGPRVGISTAEPVGVAVNAGGTVIRNGPGRAYIIYPKPGMKFVVVGEDGGDTYRALLAPGQSVYIKKNQLRLLPQGAPLPLNFFSRIETRELEDRTQVRLNLPDRVPYTVEQTANGPDQHLDLRLYQTSPDVDYIVSAFPGKVVRDVRWVQEQDFVTRVRIDLNAAQQWGYGLTYEGNTLVLSVKHPPRLDRARPLQGRVIVVDPGHGGDDNGGAGPLRVPEKNLTLPIALKLADKLRALGASVTLTRDTDVTVDLYARPLKAEALNADLILSVHANALPDGADPALSRGAGAYFFHPQARALADALLAGVLESVPEVGSDGAHYQNLALTRPSGQLSVLFETAFLTDKGNLRLLMSEAGQAKFAQGLADGVLNFYRQNR